MYTEARVVFSVSYDRLSRVTPDERDAASSTLPVELR